MSAKHSPEPWRVFPAKNHPPKILAGEPSDAGIVATMGYPYNGNREANAARIAACVNACAGMENPADEIAALKEAHDSLMDRVTLLEDLIFHAEIHGGYQRSGFNQMTTEQQLLWESVVDSRHVAEAEGRAEG